MTQAANSANRKSGYLPSLDGWRAIAIIGVLLVHDTSWAWHGGPLPSWQEWGNSGVNLFFALSGVLITTRILEEERLSGRFDIRGFYTRRLLRIQPAAVLYLMVVAILMAFGVFHNQWRHWFGAMFMYENFLWTSPDTGSVAYAVGHFWTLAVEEHFYLLLSLLLFLLRRFRAVVLFSCWVLLQIVEKSATYFNVGIYSRRTYWNLGYLVLPAALAVVLRKPRVHAWAMRWLQPCKVFGVSFAIVVYQGLKLLILHQLANTWQLSGAEIGSAALGTLVRYVFPFWVIATMLHPAAWTTRVLEWKPFRWVGKISYSLYLWHVLFFVPALLPNYNQPVMLALSTRPLKYILSFLMAALSYYLLELPCMRLGHRLAAPQQAGRPELAKSGPLLVR